MLMHFRCEGCGTVLAARADFAGREMTCRICGRHVTVPAASAPPPAQARPQPMEGDAELAGRIAREADQSARKIAWDEAREAAGRGNTAGIVLTVLGAVATCCGGAGFYLGAALWIPRSSAAVTVGFGLLALMIGATVWRLAAETMREEFRRRIPRVADRLRRQYWEAHQSRAQLDDARAGVG